MQFAQFKKPRQIFIILVSIHFNFYIYIYYLIKISFYITADENGGYQVIIDIVAIYVLLLSIIHFCSTSVNGSKSCRKKAPLSYLTITFPL